MNLDSQKPHSWSHPSQHLIPITSIYPATIPQYPPHQRYTDRRLTPHHIDSHALPSANRFPPGQRASVHHHQADLQSKPEVYHSVPLDSSYGSFDTPMSAAAPTTDAAGTASGIDSSARQAAFAKLLKIFARTIVTEVMDQHPTISDAKTLRDIIVRTTEDDI